ncbi:hypothetical protein SAMN05421538_10830 [Paracoccus isoporae]|uniref:Uncharacterized protein n=1 Tax=Paracoccus isoporae TaxID=591205 RepID=A0A1G7E003_9RHOB|nr:hypothetical protein [Paracoccus isoporae]SDE56756.1 hypothetical protein SAMN05421538_10830 [Paracoccus isoporae]
MADVLLLLGTALCVLSVLSAIISVLRTQAPRPAAILLCLGIAVLVVAAVIEPGSVGFDQIGAAFGRVFG